MELKAGGAAQAPPTGGAHGTPSGASHVARKCAERRCLYEAARGGRATCARLDRQKEAVALEWIGTLERKPWWGQVHPDRTALNPGPQGLLGPRENSCRPRSPQVWCLGSPGKPQMAWEVSSSRMTLLAPWDPNYKAKAGSQLVWGPSCASGASFSGRTLCHPSFWPLYDAALGRGCRPLATAGHQNREQVPRDAGFPVMCGGDVFFSDPLLPPGQRVPLQLSEASQQVMGSLKLQLPPPIMSPWVYPTQSPGCSTAWLSGPELIAVTGLLQMSQEEPRASSTGSSASPTPPAGSPDPVSDHPDPTGGQSCCHCTDPSLPQTPDTCCP